jgi:hypothetical protein
VSSRPTLVRSVARIAVAGVATALVAGALGMLLERARLGATDEAAARRIADELGQRFADASADLIARTSRVTATSGARLTLDPRDTTAPRSLFEGLAAELPPDSSDTAGVTLYNSRGNPVAWAGRVSDVPRDRIDGPASLFVSLDALGPRARDWFASNRYRIRRGPMDRRWAASSPNSWSSPGPTSPARSPTRSVCRPRSST